MRQTGPFQAGCNHGHQRKKTAAVRQHGGLVSYQWRSQSVRRAARGCRSGYRQGIEEPQRGKPRRQDGRSQRGQETGSNHAVIQDSCQVGCASQGLAANGHTLIVTTEQVSTGLDFQARQRFRGVTVRRIEMADGGRVLVAERRRDAAEDAAEDAAKALKDKSPG